MNIVMIRSTYQSTLCLLTLSLSLGLGACSSRQSISAGLDSPSTHENEQALLETAQSIEKSLLSLASAQEAKSPVVINTAPLVTKQGGMGGLVDIDWAGPIGPLLSRVAEMTHYRVKFLGTPPTIPILVSISAKDIIIADIIQNASLQAKDRAKILVFPDSRVIELRYLSP